MVEGSRSEGHDLTGGEIGATLWRLTVPGVLSHLAVMGFVLADLYFVGRLGSEPLAAMSYTIAIAALSCTVASGLGIGVTATVARARGRGDDRRVGALSTDGFLLSVGVTAGLCLVGALTIQPLFSAMGAQGGVLDAIEVYMRPWYLAMALFSVPVTCNCLLRALGDSRTPLCSMALMAGVNILLDPCLIFGLGPFPALGLAGAAWASAIASGLGALYGLHVLIVRERRLFGAGLDRARLRSSAREVLTIALPGMTITAIAPIGLAVLTAIVAREGDASVAAFAIGNRVELVVHAIPIALADALLAFVGQNLAAKRWSRVRRAVRGSVAVMMLAGLAIAAALLSVASPLASVFTSDSSVSAGVRSYLWIVPISYAGMGVAMVVCPVFLSTSRGGMAIGVMLGRMAGMMIPAAILGLTFGGLQGLFVGLAAANVAGGILAWGLCRRSLRTLETTSAADRSPRRSRPAERKARRDGPDTWLGLGPATA